MPGEGVSAGRVSAGEISAERVPARGVRAETDGFLVVDEQRHTDAQVEAWWFWGADETGEAGVYAGLELRGRRVDYWAGMVRTGSPYLYVEELDSASLRQGLEIKPPEMWAGHHCDVPFRQWSVGNEAHGVLLDDPTEAWRRAYGLPVPTTFDIEWYGEPDTVAPLAGLAPGARGYRQTGSVDVEIELLEGVLRFSGPGQRVHVWGQAYLPTSFAMPIDVHGLRAPYRRSDGRLVDQVLTDRWWVSVRDLSAGEARP
ncbi:MAG TPA: hypothetical protein PLV68_04025 [Ilumatobacteraceae bacterium]|nr:hypothetical protein [Ilumatobacteraceae bacterium]